LKILDLDRDEHQGEAPAKDCARLDTSHEASFARALQSPDILEVSDYENVLSNCIARYLNRHPNGNPCDHLVDLCPLMGAISHDRFFAVTDTERILHYRGVDRHRLDLTVGTEIPELPELRPVRECLQDRRPSRMRFGVMGDREGELEVTALPVLGLDGSLAGSFVIFESIGAEGEARSRAHADLVQKLAALHKFNSSLDLLVTEHELFERAVDAASDILGYEYCAVFLHNAESHELVMNHSAGYGAHLHRLAIPLRDGKGITAHAFRRNAIVSVPDVKKDPRYVEGSERVRSELAIPIQVARRVVGVFSAASANPGAFSEEEVKLCVTLVNQLNLAMERLRLFGQLASSRDVLIFALARLAESRDDDTGGHLDRICGYTRAIAECLREQPRFSEVLDEHYMDDLYRSAALHDIGKVGIPDSILRKKGRLTAEEFEIMKTHTLIGGETLGDAEKRMDNLELLRMSKTIALYHHEKWNGSGYPFALSGAEIPLAARIVCLADVYDALTTKRCYKEPYSHQVASKYIVSAGGKHFDPEIVSAFLSGEQRVLEIKRRYAA